MPRYFFNLQYDQLRPEHVVAQLPTREVAHREAVQLAAGLLKEAGERFRGQREWRVDVKDAEGELLVSIVLLGAEAGAPRPHLRPAAAALNLEHFDAAP